MAIAAKPVHDVVTELGVDLHNGLTDEQVSRSRERYGSNRFTPTPKPSLLTLYLEKFKDPTIIILCVAAAISIGLGIIDGHWIEGLGIIVAVLVATGVGFASEYKSNNEFELLTKQSEAILVKVTRGGQFHVIPIDDLVVGDLSHLEMGDKVPADLHYLHGVDFAVNESLMTGESRAVRKDDENPLLLRGTVVEEGSSAALVIAVGDRTKLGEIKDSLVEEASDTPLQEKLGALATKIGQAGTIAALLIFAALLVQSLLSSDPARQLPVVPGLLLGIGLGTVGAAVFFMSAVGRRGMIGAVVLCVVLSGIALSMGQLNNTHLTLLVSFFLVAVTVVVVAVPEGLPLAVTVSLAFSMRKIAKDGNLVRKLVATETIGSANVIASDKTGTLTKNQMNVQQLYVHRKLYSGAETLQIKQHPAFELLALNTAANSTAHLEFAGQTVSFVGSSTEGALLAWMHAQGVPYEEVRERTPILKRISFSGDRKMMTTVVERDGTAIVLTKGAPDRLLLLCSSIETADGVQPISPYLDEVQGQIDRAADDGMRTLALTYRVIPLDEAERDDLERDLTLLAIVAIADPVREDVAAAIATCKLAGIDVKMVTGDHIKTATAIAREIGLLEPDSVIMTGQQMRELSAQELAAVLPKLRVIARAQPLDKLKLVEGLQALDQVVAVTGDGTNDAPALKRADVGISMGKSGTDVAKEASDIILLNDDFGSIVRAVHWGRALYENIQKFIQFQLTVNVSALTIAFLGALFGFGLPLTVIQLLWVNLIMDTLAALALGLEPPTPGLMRRPPKRRDEPMITRSMWSGIFTLSIFFLVCILALLQFNFLGGETKEEQLTIVFATFVFFQIFNMLNCRSLDPSRSGLAGLGRSPAFPGVMGLIVVTTILIVTFGGAVFRTVPLDAITWVKIIAFTSIGLIYGEISRMVRARLMSSSNDPALAPSAV